MAAHDGGRPRQVLLYAITSNERHCEKRVMTSHVRHIASECLSSLIGFLRKHE